MNWFCIRHGEIESNRLGIYSGRSDESLTDLGRSQVRQAASDVARLGIEAIFCSPLRRTRQTTALLLEALGAEIPVHVDHHFNEIKMGPWSGMREDQVAQEYPQAWALWQSNPAKLELPERETLAQLQARAIAGIKAIERNHSYAAALIVSHVAVIRCLSLYATGLDLNRYKTIAVANAEIFTLDLPSLT